MSLHLPVAILAALSLTSGDRVAGLYDGRLMGISHARLANSSLKPDLSEVIAEEKLNASIADDFRIAPERVVIEDVNRPDHGPSPMSFSARARLFGVAICTALVALLLAFFLDVL
jgi:hypothetical protein